MLNNQVSVLLFFDSIDQIGFIDGNVQHEILCNNIALHQREETSLYIRVKVLTHVDRTERKKLRSTTTTTTKWEVMR